LTCHPGSAILDLTIFLRGQEISEVITKSNQNAEEICKFVNYCNLINNNGKNTELCQKSWFLAKRTWSFRLPWQRLKWWRHNWPVKISRRMNENTESWNWWFLATRFYPSFCSMKRLGVFLLPLDGMLLHRRPLPRNLLGFPNNSPVLIYNPEWREALWELSVLPKNTTQCPWPGLEPGPLDPGPSALTMRPPRLPEDKWSWMNWHLKKVFTYLMNSHWKFQLLRINRRFKT